MTNKNITLKDLVVDFESNNFAVAFGVSEESAMVIATGLEKIFKEVSSKPEWTASEIFIEATKLNLAINWREVALVTYLIGCNLGEYASVQKVVNAAKKFGEVDSFPLSRVKKGKYIN